MREVTFFDEKTNQARVLMKGFPNGTILRVARTLSCGAHIISDDAMLMRVKPGHHRCQ